MTAAATDDQAEPQPTSCPTCGQPVPAKQPPATDAKPSAKHIVDLSDVIGLRRVHLPDADVGDYSGSLVIQLNGLFAAKIPLLNVWRSKPFDPAAVWLDHGQLLELCRVTIDRPPPVAVVSLAKKRAQHAADARTPQPKGETA